MGEIVFYLDFRADFGAFHTGNAGGLAVFAGQCAFLAIAAGDVNANAVFAARSDFVQSARTNAYTGPAGGAFVGVDFRQSGLRIHFNGAERAVANAVAQTQTAVGTAGFADKGTIGKSAALQADVFDFVGSVFTSAVAVQNCNRRFVFGGRIAKPSGNCVHHSGTAHRTIKAGERFGVGSGAGVGEILTARFAAGAAVGLWKHCCNFVGYRVVFSLKFLGCKI